MTAFVQFGFPSSCIVRSPTPDNKTEEVWFAGYQTHSRLSTTELEIQELWDKNCV